MVKQFYVNVLRDSCEALVGCFKFRRTTNSQHNLPVTENLVARNFKPDAPNRVWAADLTFVKTWEGWLYLSVVIDLFSRRVVGLSHNMHSELFLAALQNGFQ